MNLNLALLVLGLTVLQPQDARVVPATLPGTAGLAVVQWEPALTAPPVFNFFVDADGRLLIGTHYETYQEPVLRLSVAATYHLRSAPVVFERGRRYQIVAFWREIAGHVEMGLYLNGRQVGYAWHPITTPLKTWMAEAWIGMRAGGRPVGDPSFPGCAHADGRLSVAIWTQE